MPKKSRISRAKRKAQNRSSLLAAKEVSRRSQPLPFSSKPDPVAKPITIVNEHGGSLLRKYALPDMKRSLITAAFLLAVLLILYFFLH